MIRENGFIHSKKWNCALEPVEKVNLFNELISGKATKPTQRKFIILLRMQAGMSKGNHPALYHHIWCILQSSTALHCFRSCFHVLNKKVKTGRQISKCHTNEYQMNWMPAASKGARWHWDAFQKSPGNWLLQKLPKCNQTHWHQGVKMESP